MRVVVVVGRTTGDARRWLQIAPDAGTVWRHRPRSASEKGTTSIQVRAPQQPTDGLAYDNYEMLLSTHSKMREICIFIILITI